MPASTYLAQWRRARKHYTPEEKVAILRRHLLDKDPVSGGTVVEVERQAIEEGHGL